MLALHVLDAAMKLHLHDRVLLLFGNMISSCVAYRKNLCQAAYCPIFLQDWIDIDFAISEKVDFIAVSFVKGPDVINNLKSYLASRAGSSIEVIAKVESYDSVPNVPQIVEASDAVMVARGDLGDTH